MIKKKGECKHAWAQEARGLERGVPTQAQPKEKSSSAKHNKRMSEAVSPCREAGHSPYSRAPQNTLFSLTVLPLLRENPRRLLVLPRSPILVFDSSWDSQGDHLTPH